MILSWYIAQVWAVFLNIQTPAHDPIWILLFVSQVFIISMDNNLQSAVPIECSWNLWVLQLLIGAPALSPYTVSGQVLTFSRRMHLGGLLDMSTGWFFVAMAFAFKWMEKWRMHDCWPCRHPWHGHSCHSPKNHLRMLQLKPVFFVVTFPALAKC